MHAFYAGFFDIYVVNGQNIPIKQFIQRDKIFMKLNKEYLNKKITNMFMLYVLGYTQVIFSRITSRVSNCVKC